MEEHARASFVPTTGWASSNGSDSHLTTSVAQGARPLGAALLVVVVACASRPAFGYVRTPSAGNGSPLFWSSPTLKLVPDAPAGVGSLDRNGTLEAIRMALGAWSQPGVACSRVQLSLDANSGSRSFGEYQVVRLLFRKDYWGRLGRDDVLSRYDPKMLAVTTLSAKKDGSGEIVSADIEINAIHYRWGDLSSPRPEVGAQDLVTTLVHEIGHVLGLGHTCDDGDGLKDDTGASLPSCVARSSGLEAARKTVMFPAPNGAPGLVRRELSSDERRALCTIYPRKASGCGCRLSPAMSCSEGGAIHLVVLAALGAAIRAAGRRIRTGSKRPRTNEVLRLSDGRSPGVALKTRTFGSEVEGESQDRVVAGLVISATGCTPPRRAKLW